jgi:hypothetical protein
VPVAVPLQWIFTSCTVLFSSPRLAKGVVKDVHAINSLYIKI